MFTCCGEERHTRPNLLLSLMYSLYMVCIILYPSKHNNLSFFLSFPIEYRDRDIKLLPFSAPHHSHQCLLGHCWWGGAVTSNLEKWENSKFILSHLFLNAHIFIYIIFETQITFTIFYSLLDMLDYLRQDVEVILKIQVIISWLSPNNKSVNCLCIIDLLYIAQNFDPNYIKILTIFMKIMLAELIEVTYWIDSTVMKLKSLGQSILCKQCDTLLNLRRYRKFYI